MEAPPTPLTGLPGSANALPLDIEIALTRPDFTLDVKLRLPGRGITALYGPSGSGKTTCLRVLAGLERATRGRLTVAGEVWQDSSSNVFRAPHQRAIGYVFQEASLLPHLNVEGNLKFGFNRVPPAQRRYGWDHGLALLGIERLLERWPHQLSGGERQRVAIARALATSPALLLMDEPLGALDAVRKAEILPYLERLHRELELPVVYVSHALEEVARLSDHLVLLDGGRVTASGPTGELLTRPDLELAHGDGAACIIEAAVTAQEPDYHLSHADFSGGRLTLLHTGLCLGQRLRVRVQARDVSLTLQRQEGTSVQNIVAVHVTAVSPDAPGQVMVHLDAGGVALLARITQKSADQLALRQGQALYAQIKSVAVLG